MEDYTVTVGSVVSIGNLVWIDADNDGVKDATETGQPGVTMQLWTPGPNGVEDNGAGDDVKVGSDIITDIDGNYVFSALAAGTYYVRIPAPPADFPLTSGIPDAADNQQDGDNNGRQPSGIGTAIRSPTITLTVGAEPAAGVDGDDTNGDLTIDFGLASSDPCYSSNLIDNPSFELEGGANVTGDYFASLSYNGTGTTFGTGVNSLRWVSGVNPMSALNDPIQRMKVLAVGSGAKVAWLESTRAHQGRRFMVLEGELSCVEVKPAGGGTWSSVLQAGKTYQFSVWADTASAANASFELDLGASQPIFKIGTSGTLLHYYAATQNRWVSPSGGPSSFSSAHYNGWNETTANSTQPNWRRYIYTFAISPTATAAQIDSASLILSATAGSGPVAIDDIVLCQPSMTLGNHVWNDADYDGIKEAGESAMAGLTVQLFDPGSDGVIDGAVADTQVGANTTTDATGSYRFTNLSPGNYYVRVTPPANTVTTANVATTDNNVDNNNDGSQPGGVGTALLSPVINLALAAESVTDGDSDSNSNLTIDFGLFTCPTIIVSPILPAAGTVGVAYSQTISASGGTAPYTLALTSGTLPSGLTFNASTGVISGTPTTSNGAGTSLTFTATDSRGCRGTRTFALKICPVLTLATLNATLTVGTPYSSSAAASAGTSPVSPSTPDRTAPCRTSPSASTTGIPRTAPCACKASVTTCRTSPSPPLRAPSSSAWMSPRVPPPTRLTSSSR